MNLNGFTKAQLEQYIAEVKERLDWYYEVGKAFYLKEHEIKGKNLAMRELREYEYQLKKLESK